MFTFDRRTIDSSGVFLMGELERLDQTMYMPLVSITHGRDIKFREDVSIADEVSSFTNSSFAAAGGSSTGSSINWIGKDATAISGLALDIGKTATPLNLIGYELGWTIPELASAQQLGRPVDSQKFEAMTMKHQMDIDQMVYVGDSQLSYNGSTLTGLWNSDTKVGIATNAVTGNWNNGTTIANQIITDIATFEEQVWAATGFSIVARKLALPPVQLAYLNATIVSTAGNVSLLTYIRVNSLCMAENGVPLEIVSSKWLTNRGVGNTQRMVLYTNERQFVRFPLVPLQRTPVEYRGINQLTTYFGRLGAVEFPRSETIGYCDGI